MQALIRPAIDADLGAINDIYNHYVLNSTATFAETPMTAEERQSWWRERQGRFPMLIAGLDNYIIGWAALSQYSGRCAYRFTVENSIYIRPESCGMGIGRRLLAALLDSAVAGGFHSVLGIISAESKDSLRLHFAAGYTEVGRLREVGFKFGRWIDVVFAQKLLRPGAGAMSAEPAPTCAGTK